MDNALVDDEVSLFMLSVWTIMDGTVVDNRKYNENSHKIRIQFKLSKPRKIMSLRYFLDSRRIPYTFAKCKKCGVNKLQPYYIRIYGNWARAIFNEIGKKKEIPWKWMESEGLLRLFLSLLLDTDGNINSRNRLGWATVHSWNAQAVSTWLDMNGVEYTKRILRNHGGFDNAQDQFLFNIQYDTHELTRKSA